MTWLVSDRCISSFSASRNYPLGAAHEQGFLFLCYFSGSFAITLGHKFQMTPRLEGMNQ